MALDNSTVAIAGTNASALEYNSLRGDTQTGWMKPARKVGGVYQDDSWAYSGVSGDTGTVTVSSDGRERYEVGMKVRFKQGGAFKYFEITAVNETTIDFTAGAEYTLVNAAITDLYISHDETPLDWPLKDEIVISGWDFVGGDDSIGVSDSVSFGVTFADRPVVVCTPIGYKTSDPTHIADLSIGMEADDIWVVGPVISTTGFSARLRKETGATFVSGRRYLYSWFARGKLA
jgi:hypothetical protein